MRILVAEDETLVRLDIRALLTANGFEVCGEACDGIEAVELAHELGPDLALLDVTMPRLDGIEAARRIRLERPIPIVILTAHRELAVVTEAIDAGIGAYLAKPFRESDLVAAIRTAAARNAELVSVRQELRARPAPPLDLRVHSRGGDAWPLRIRRFADDERDG